MRGDSEPETSVGVVPLRAAAGWRLIHRTPNGADVLATGTDGIRRGLLRLGRADGTLAVTETRDHHWQWTLTDPQDAPIVMSPPIYRDPGACRRAFLDARRAAAQAASALSAEPVR